MELGERFVDGVKGVVDVDVVPECSRDEFVTRTGHNGCSADRTGEHGGELPALIDCEALPHPPHKRTVCHTRHLA